MAMQWMCSSCCHYLLLPQEYAALNHSVFPSRGQSFLCSVVDHLPLISKPRLTLSWVFLSFAGVADHSGEHVYFSGQNHQTSDP